MFSFTTIAEYHLQLSQSIVSSTDAVNYYLAQIENNKQLNAFVDVFEKDALQKAAALDESRKAGKPLKKLHGVVIAIKDVICYKDHTVTASSAILKDFTSLYTASALQYLIDEDAIIIGSCNCDEFAMGSTNENSAYGKVLNALDHTKVPGGSSGGSAVAVQANMCMLSLGSDTGGSVRQPADFCGIIGLKPGYGTISRYGLIAYASSFDQIGIFGKTIEDVALLLDIMRKPDPYDSTMQQKLTQPETVTEKIRYCLFKQVMEHPSLDVEIKNSINNVAEELKAQGHIVDYIDFDLLDYIVPTYYVLTTAEASSNLSRFDGVRYGSRSALAAESIEAFYKQNRSEGFGLEVKRRIMLGTFVLSTGYYDAYFSKAQQIRRLLVDKTSEIFSNYDAILMPVSPTTAMKIGDTNQDLIAAFLADIFTVFANLTGIPGIALPLFWHSNDNMPFGLQVMTDKTNEHTLVDIANILMQQFKPAALPIN
jgi:aspartyl-tRNA(Asn)/glutamyl-tRNA(Gln) amidotransferase subunit A